MDVAIRVSASIGLMYYAFYQYQHDTNWWLYTPFYVFPAAVFLVKYPENRLWRTLSGVALVGGGLFLLFIWWTYHSLEGTVDLRRLEGRNMLPVAIGVALGATTRITSDKIERPIHYIRTTLLLALLAGSMSIIMSTGKYFSQ